MCGRIHSQVYNMKIAMYNGGGPAIQSVYTPQVRDTYLNEEASVSASSSGKKKDKGKNWIEDAVVDAIKQGGLQSDVDIFLSQAEQFLSDSQSLYDADTDAFLGNNAVLKLIALRKMANVVKENKAAYDEAAKHMYKEGVGSDVALDETGKMYVVSDGKLDTITVATFRENKDKYTPLTNSQLLELRRNTAQLAGRTDIISSVNNAIGIKNVSQTIENVIEQLGEQKKKGVALKVSGQVQKGLEGLYTINSTTSNAAVSKESMLAAISYIKNTRLNQNERNVLKATAELGGVSEDELIYNELTMHISNVYEETPKKASSDSASSSGSGDVKGTQEESYIEQVVNGRTVVPSNIVLGSSDHSHGFSTEGRKYPLINEKHDKIGRNNLKNVLEQTSIGGVVDMKSIFIGNTAVPDYLLNRVVYDGTSTLDRVYLPIDTREYKTTGRIKPDFVALQKYEKFKQWKKQHPNATAQEESIKMQELDVPGVTVKNGKWEFANTHLFLTTKAYVNDEALDIDNDDTMWLDKVSAEENKRVGDIYENLVAFGTESAGKNKDRTDKVNHWTRWNWDALYHGTVFMPVGERGMEVIAAGNELASKSQYMDIANQIQTQEQERSLKLNF